MPGYPCHYDDPDFNYPKYWQNRQYEDKAERIALKKLFRRIPKKESLLDIGGGYGRLTNEYAPLFKEAFLIDPSEKLLSLAQSLKQKYPQLKLKRATAEELPFKDNHFQTILMIRTLHHLKHPQKAIKEIARVLKPGGWLILEFANKTRLRSLVKALLKFDFNFFTSHQPIDICRQKGDIPFVSFHPSQVKTLLLANRLKISKILSVSNFRDPTLKKIIPLPALLTLESIISSASSFFPVWRFFGPSVFVLAQKEE